MILNDFFWYDYKWNFLNKKYLLNAEKNYIIKNIKHLLIDLMIICVRIRNCNAFLVEILWTRSPWIAEQKNSNDCGLHK